MKDTRRHLSCREDAGRASRRAGNRPQGDLCEALDKSSVADLSAALIEGMTRDELVRVIRAADLPLLSHSGLVERLAYYGRDTLTRLAHLARRSCHNHGSSTTDVDPSRDGSLVTADAAAQGAY